MKKNLHNLIVRIRAAFIKDKTKRKDFRKKNLIDKNANLKEVQIKGENNRIIVVKNGVEQNLKIGDKLYGVQISICGNNNTIKLNYPINFINSTIIINKANDSYVEINPSPYIDGLLVNVNYGSGQQVVIGKNTTCCGLKIEAPSSSSCLIGEDCMFAEYVKCWAGDCHAITDKTTGELINNDSKALVIGDHCWLGESARVLKNAELPNNTIVGLYSVVTKKFDEENLIICGNPAKIIRKNAVWHRSNQCKEGYIET